MAKVTIKQAILDNCADIAALEAKVESITKTYWRINPEVARGFAWETWSPGEGSNTSQVGFETSWSGAPVNGIPQHAAGAPTSSGVETDTRFSQAEQGQDEHRLCHWIHNDRAVAIEIQDTDGRAESIRVYASCDCPASLVHERYQSEGAPYTSQGPFITIPAGGLVKLTTLIHDPGPDFSGFRPIANEVGDTATFDPTSYQQRPSIECQEFGVCEDIPEGWEPKEIVLDCHDCGSGGSEIDPSLIFPLSDKEPIPDQDGDLKRESSPGVMAEASRCDHTHAIERRPRTLNPVVTVTGPGITLINQLILDFESDEETEYYKLRVQVNTDDSNGWQQIIIPSFVATHQEPRITGIGNYRNQSNVPQVDDNTGTGATGAAPRGPFMGKEWHEWSSTRRLYHGYFRKDAASGNQFVEFWVAYKCR